MGYALTWVAFLDQSAAEVFHSVELRGTGRLEEFPESDLTGIQIDQSYVVVGFNDDMTRLAELNFAGLSKKSRIVWCAVEEHTGFSMAEKWQDGKRVWAVSHEAAKGVNNLREWGNLPPQYETIRDGLKSQQEANDAAIPRDPVDYIFDIPVQLAHVLAGYRYDEEIEAKAEILELATRPWWKLMMSIEWPARNSEEKKIYRRANTILISIFLVVWMVAILLTRK